jgi:hypothetical protein
MKRWVALIAIAACGSPAAQTPKRTKKAIAKTEDDEPAPAPRACKIKVDARGFTVDDERFDVGKNRERDAVSLLPLEDGSTLVADLAGEHLWWVDCTRKRAVKSVVDSSEASTIAGQITADGKTFVFSDGAKLQALDLGDRDLRTVYRTKQEPQKDCPAHASQVKVPEDTFHGFAENGDVILHRSMLCQWPDTHEVRLVDWDDPDKRADHPAHPIYAIAADGKGTLWMVDGGGLAKSTDRGDTWKPVKIKIAKQPESTPADPDGGAPVQIIADAKKPNVIVVRTSIISSVAQGRSGATFPGLVLRSRDGGVRWERVSTPDDRLVDQVYSPTNDANDLVIPGTLSRDEPEEQDADTEGPAKPERGLTCGFQPARCFARPDAIDTPLDELTKPRAWVRTRDGGTKWKIAAKAPVPPPAKLEVNGDIFEATRDGLYRTRGGKREKITKDLDAPYPRDLF